MNLKRNDKRKSDSSDKQNKGNRFMRIAKTKERNPKTLKAKRVQNVINPPFCVYSINGDTYNYWNQSKNDPCDGTVFFFKSIPCKKNVKYTKKITKRMRKHGFCHFFPIFLVFRGINRRGSMKQEREKNKITNFHFNTPFLGKSVTRHNRSVKKQGEK